MRQEYIIETFSRKPLLKSRQYYFRLKSINGEIIAQSEGVNNKVDRDQVAGKLSRRLDALLVNITP